MAELTFLSKQPNKTTPHNSPRIAFVTLGCKVNQSDTQRAIADFRGAGFCIVPPQAPADVYVVNTCSVTHIADRKSRQWLRRSARANPDALVVATGCYAESGRDTLSGMDGVGLLVGYRQKDDLLRLVLDRLPHYTPVSPAPLAQHEKQPAPSWAGGAEGQDGDLDPDYRLRIRAMVKIEDGCNDFCTFCIIPFTRGMPRSTPTHEVVRLVRQRVEEGFKEIVLTGVHMGKYGQDHAQRKRAAADHSEARDLPGVVRAVLEYTQVPRLRITSIEPTDAVMVIPLLTDPAYKARLTPHLHLPLQSGCDAVLARMKRDYTTEEYAAVVRQVREARPELSITTDLITGFPGETEEEWAATLNFVQKMEFAKIHVFPYSQRPGTPAAEMEGQVAHEVRHTRTLEMLELGSRAEAAYAVQHLGQARPVLWERQSDDGVWSGLTDNYIRVFTRSSSDLQNKITFALPAAYDSHGLWAEVVKPL